MLESWYTHPRQEFPMGGKMCLNLDTFIQDKGFQGVGKCALEFWCTHARTGFQWAGICDWILIHPPNARISNGWGNVLESWYTYPRAGFPMDGKMCLNLDTPKARDSYGHCYCHCLCCSFCVWSSWEQWTDWCRLFIVWLYPFFFPVAMRGESGSIYE